MDRHAFTIKISETMKRYIHIAREDREFIEKAFGVSGRMVYNALTFDAKKGNSDLARRIRKIAMDRGGVVMVETPEVETLHDYDGVISQYFPNGAKLELDKETGDGTIYFKGKAVKWFDDVRLDAIQDIQNLAGMLNSGNVALLNA